MPDAELGRGIAAGVAALDGQGRVPQAQLPPQPVPVLWKPGDLKVHAGPVVEEGWLPADGGESSRIEDAALFAAIGTAWGEGDGATTFNRPDYSDAFILGASATRPVGTTGGEESTYAHREEDTGARTWCRAREGARRRLTPRLGAQARAGLTGKTGKTGGGEAHNNMPPFAAALVVIKR